MQAVAGYGPPGDFNHQPTRRADLGASAHHPPDQADFSAETGAYPPLDSPDLELAPTPWYRKPAVLIAWGLLVAILITLIIYGLIELAGRGGGGSTPTHTTSTTPATTTTTSPAPTTTSTTPTATTEPPPSNAPPEAPAPPAAPPPAEPPAPTHTHRRPHLPELPKLPPTISVPGVPTVITVPPGLR